MDRKIVAGQRVALKNGPEHARRLSVSQDRNESLLKEQGDDSMDSIYNPDGTYALPAEDVDRSIRQAAADIFKFYRGSCSPRELGHVMLMAVMDAEMEELLIQRQEAEKKEPK